MKPLRVLFIALLPACAAPYDADVSEPLSGTSAAGAAPCDADPGAYEAACFDEGIGACCPIVAIPHEYEMLEAREHGDLESAAAQEHKMREALDTGCSLDHEPSCAALDRLDSSAK